MSTSQMHREWTKSMLIDMFESLDISKAIFIISRCTDVHFSQFLSNLYTTEMNLLVKNRKTYCIIAFGVFATLHKRLVTAIPIGSREEASQ